MLRAITRFVTSVSLSVHPSAWNISAPTGRKFDVFRKFYMNTYVRAVAQWLRCCATNRKDASSIPADVSGFFIDIKSFRPHYDPGVDSASNKSGYQEYLLGGKGGRCVRLTTYRNPVPLSRNLGILTSWNHLGLSRPLMGLLYLFCLCTFMTTSRSVLLRMRNCSGQKLCTKSKHAF